MAWAGPKWELAAACFSLKGGRADWLVEKATELGAWGLRPILTIRSPHLGASGSPTFRSPDCQNWAGLASLVALQQIACLGDGSALPGWSMARMAAGALLLCRSQTLLLDTLHVTIIPDGYCAWTTRKHVP